MTQIAYDKRRLKFRFKNFKKILINRKQSGLSAFHALICFHNLFCRNYTTAFILYSDKINTIR